MEKVSLYVKKILALLLSFFVFFLMLGALNIDPDVKIQTIIVGLLASLLFAYLDFRITGEKPRFLFGLNQSDGFLNKKGGFWNLFKWIVNSLGFLYDLIVWSIWGIFLVFVLFVDFLLLIKTIVYWIIHALIWFLRQLFPPFIFIFKMIIHYLINWVWWIYQLAVNNVKISINKNFYFIALWGTIPALFIVFLFYAISQLVGIPGLVLISVVFALIPLVWSYGEISALRFENREKDDYSSVSSSFNNGFEAVRSVLFYLVIILILLIAEIILNLLGWIPNLSMSLLGITLNLNMAFSFILVFMAIIIAFAGSILPTHILYKPEYNNDFNSSLGFLEVIGKKFVRYIFSGIPSSFFGGILLIIPIVVMLLTFSLTDTIKDSMLDSRIENLTQKARSLEALDSYRTEKKIDRLAMYKEIPEQASDYFTDLRNSSERVNEIKRDLADSREQLLSKKANFEKAMSDINAELAAARTASSNDPLSEEVTYLTNRRLDLEETYLSWEKTEKECVAFLEVDLKEQKSVRAQMPILYFFMGILFAVFGGIVFAVFIAYIGNVYFELYNMKEDDKPTYWVQTLNDIRAKDSNQPLLGFTFLLIIAAITFAILRASLIV